MMAACYKSGNDKSDNNKNKVYLFLIRKGLVSYMLDLLLDYMLDYMFGLHARSYNHRSHDHGVIIVFLFLYELQQTSNS